MEFHTTEEVAQMLRVTGITVERWLAGGKLRGTKVGKRWLITPQDLKEFIYSEAKGGKQ